jgi:hypothetical protein
MEIWKINYKKKKIKFGGCNCNMNSIKIMIFLWQIGVVDSLTLIQFFINCGTQYAGLTLAELATYTNDASNLRPTVLLAPVHGLGTSYKYVRAAQGAMERKARVAALASFMEMSGGATFTDPTTNAAAGAPIASFIAHMKNVIAANNTGGLVFANPAIFSKLTSDEFIILKGVITSGVLLIVISSYVLPRIAKAYWDYSKKSA